MVWLFCVGALLASGLSTTGTHWSVSTSSIVRSAYASTAPITPINSSFLARESRAVTPWSSFSRRRLSAATFNVAAYISASLVRWRASAKSRSSTTQTSRSAAGPSVGGVATAITTGAPRISWVERQRCVRHAGPTTGQSSDGHTGAPNGGTLPQRIVGVFGDVVSARLDTNVALRIRVSPIGHRGLTLLGCCPSIEVDAQ